MAMATNYNESVPGQNCFNLNFSNPGGSFIPPILLNTQPNVSTNSEPTLPNPTQSDVPAPSFEARQPVRRKNYMRDNMLPNGKKTKGRVKIKMEYIENKLRRYTTFSKRKTGIMKKAYELSTLTGTQVMLLVASETGHVYTFATKKLQPMITSEAGKALIQTCLNTPDPLATDGLCATTASISESVETVAAMGSSGLQFTNESGIKPSPKPRTNGKATKNGNASPLVDVNGTKFSSSYFGAGTDLPTMVAQSFGTDSANNSSPQDGSNGMEVGGYDYDDDSSSDESFDSSPFDQNNTDGNVSQASPQPPTPVTSGDQIPQQSMIFPTILPNVSAATAFGHMSGITQSGAFMYQVPQGVVYAPTVSLSEGQSNLSQLLSLAGQTMPSMNENQQQIITIPLPLSLQALTSNGAPNSSDSVV